MSSVADKILKLKYTKDKDESWEQLAWRVADYMASVENDREYWAKIFYNLIVNKVFIPGGRILKNSGTGIKNLYNCFFFNIEDSRDSIYQCLKDGAEIFAWGGGLGVRISDLREEGALIKSSNTQSSGAVSFLELFNLTGDVIQQASRRAAEIALLDVRHPDIYKFINYKSTLSNKNRLIYEDYIRRGGKDKEILEKTLIENQLTHFNISVEISDDFMEAVINDDNWELISPLDGKVVEVVSARKLLRDLAESIWRSGDPGLFFVNNVKNDNLVKYFSDVIGTNPCLYKDTLMLDGDKLVKISSGGNTFVSWKTGEKETIKLTTNAGYEIIVTPDHKIMLADGTFEEAQNLLGKEIYWAVGDRASNGVDDTFILIGFLFGDGFLTGGKLGVSVKLNPDKEKEVSKFLEKFMFNKQDSGAYYINRNRLSFDTSFLEKRIYERNVPEEVLFGDSTVVKSFLIGLFEANGSVSRNGQISLKSTNKELIKFVQVALSSFGIKSWVTSNKAVTISWNNGNFVSKESYNLQIAPRESYKFKDKIGFLSDYKNSKIKKFKKDYDGKLIVTSIEPYGIQEVWDFNNTVHYNLANGFTVHNCGEINLLSYEPCDLGSINLTQFVTEDKTIDLNSLGEVVFYAIRFLDNVHDLSENRVQKINEMAKGLRRVGLGVMGWADMLVMLDIPYDSDEAVELAEFLSKYISYNAWYASVMLAKEKGPFKFFDFEKADFNVIRKIFDNDEDFNRFIELVKEYGLRNVSVTALAPTGTIALLAEVNSCIEPYFALAYRRFITEGEGNFTKDTIIEVNKHLKKKLEDAGIFEKVKDRIYKEGSVQHIEEIPEEIKKVFKTAHDIHPIWHIKMQAAWQKGISNAISKTINLPHNATPEDIYNYIIIMWKNKVKSSTFYRDGSKDFQILNRGV